MVYGEQPHKLERDEDGEYTCSVCLWWWKRKPKGDCPGVPRYGVLPEDLKTYTGLRRLKLKPADREKPDGCYYILKSPYRRYLYSVEQALPRRRPTPRQLEAIVKMREGLVRRYTCIRCGYYDRAHGKVKYERINYYTRLCQECHDLKIRREKEARIAQWAYYLYNGPANFLILDSETTGLNERKQDEVIELAILDRSGAILFSSLIAPQDSTRDDLATHIHGISRQDLATAPTFPDVWPQIQAIIEQTPNILVYNAAFDHDLLRTTARRYGYELPQATWLCLMEEYAVYHGAWSSYWRSYTWQKLGTACYTLGVEASEYHRAAADAHNALGVLKALADLHGHIELLPAYEPPAPQATDEGLGDLEEHPF
jgi:DNA polymerase III epsilon subunit-like protein